MAPHEKCPCGSSTCPHPVKVQTFAETYYQLDTQVGALIDKYNALDEESREVISQILDAIRIEEESDRAESFDNIYELEFLLNMLESRNPS